MTLAALIAAYHEATGEGGGLRAALPVAGRTLLERQARLAQSAGADSIIVVADGRPRELVDAISRLSAEGLDIVLAAGAAEAAKAVQAGDRLLVIGDGVLVGEGDVERLLALDASALLTVPDAFPEDRFERIDSESRWAGIAVVNGELLKHTAAMLQDWDLQSTLLRRAVQTGARQMALADPGGPDLLAALRASDLADLQGRLLEGSGGFQRDWVSRYLLAPLEVAGLRRMMVTPVTPAQLWMGNLALTALSAVAFSRGWLWAGLLLFLLGTPLAGVAERLGRLRAESVRRDGWLVRLIRPLSGIALLALAYALWPGHGWGTLVLAVSTIAFLVALDGEKGRELSSSSIFLAEPKGMGWLMLLFAATGQWVAGLGALAVYAAGSFFWVQRGPRSGKLAAP
ncbi:MAG TPA: hypothetical protein VGR19_09005 [Allosphingosinicella sp.]|nr:hypothetical protein [Allosphingosinicella sp.]